MPVSSPPPVPRIDVAVDLGAGPVDLGTRGLAAAVVPAPRFGREGELQAAVLAALAVGADLADVSLEPRLMGAVVRAGVGPVAARVETAEAAAAARAAGAALVLVPPDLADQVAAEGSPAAIVVDQLAAIAAALPAADRHGLPLAFDTSRRPAQEALADEAVALSSGCRIVRTTDVRRTRRVIEVVAALLEARREA